MRLFIATPVILPIYNLIRQDLSKFIVGKWVEEWNLHITHKFIGEDNPDKYKIKLDIPNEKIKIKGLSFLGEKILYMKAISANISSINSQINKIFNLKDNFIPHITLCRIKSLKKEVFNEIKKWQDKEFEIDFEVYLYKSILTKKGPVYEKIYKY